MGFYKNAAFFSDNFFEMSSSVNQLIYISRRARHSRNLDRVNNYLFNYFAVVGTAFMEEKQIIFNPFLLHINECLFLDGLAIICFSSMKAVPTTAK